MSYFRLKKLTIGNAYRRFLDECLEPGGTIFLVDCRFSWPVTDCGDRHLFQFGALGGATIEEMHRGGPRVSEYLRRYHSSANRWNPPSPDYIAPEAEWGFAPALGKDVEEYAFANGYVLRRMVFTHPEQMSPLVADLHRWWNHRRGLSATRLLVDSFILMEPYWTLRTGSIPYWMVFNTEGSLANLQTYLADHSFEEIYLTLFSHGVDSIGLPSIADWRQAMSAANASRFLGVDERAFPRDFAVFIRYYFDLLKSIRARFPLPRSLTLAELDTFLGEHGHRFDIRWAVEPKQLTA